MTQLILDTRGYNLTLPESQKGGYRASYEPLSVDVEMITGRLVRELRGNVWCVEYQYGFFDDEMKSKLIAICRKGRREPIQCGFLPPESTGALRYGSFFVVGFNQPKFMWSRDADGLPVPLWADFSLSLREVKPSD